MVEEGELEIELVTTLPLSMGVLNATLTDHWGRRVFHVKLTIAHLKIQVRFESLLRLVVTIRGRLI